MATVTAARIIIPVNTDAGKANKQLTGLDNTLKSTSKSVDKYNSSSQKTQKTNKNLESQLKQISDSAKLFGDQTGGAAKQQDLLKNKINDLLNKGVSPNNKGVQNLKKQYDALDSQVAKTKKGFLSLGKVIGAAGVFALYKKLSAAIEENNRLFAIQEKAEAKVEAIVRATGGAAGFTANELKKQASALQNVTTTGDEVILQGQAIIATFKTISGDVFKRTTETALDLSAAFGQDIKSSAIQLGKALEDPVTGLSALRRIGVSFTDDQKKTIKALQETNRLADAQGIILDVLEQQVGGTARALAQTASGQIQQFNNAWGDVRENLGRATTEIKAALIPGLGDLVSELGEATKEGSIFDNFIKNLAQGLGIFAKQIADTIRLISLASNKFQQVLNTEGIDKLSERYEILQTRAADAFGGGTEGLKKFIAAAKTGDKEAAATLNELNRLRDETTKRTENNINQDKENEELLAKITKRIDDNAKAVDNLGKKTAGATKNFKGLGGASKEAIEAYNEAISILAGTGDISFRLKEQEQQFREQISKVKKAGLDVAALEQFQLKQREQLFANYFDTIANNQNASIDEREIALNAGLQKALAAEKITAKDRIAIQKAYIQQSEKLNQEWLQNLADGIEKYSVFATSAIGAGEAFAEFFNNQTLQEIENLRATAAERDAAAEQQETALAKQIEDLEVAGATRAEIDAAQLALDQAQAENAEAKAARDKKIADKDLELRKQQAKQQKVFGIFTTLTDTAIAITKTLASLPFPANTIAAGLVAVQGAAQTAAIYNTPIPGAQFGGEFMVPPGSPADSALLRVNQGENVSVTPTRESNNMPKSVILMIDGREFRGFFVDELNKNLNNGKAQIRRSGVVKTA